MIRRLGVLGCLLFLLTGCGGGGGSSGGGAVAMTPAAAALSNFAAISVDGGPPSITTGANAEIEANFLYVSVTLCAPGTSTCQTIDHVQVDTGSTGLRIVQAALTPAMLGALPHQTATSGDPVGECYGYIDGYAFGSVRNADFQIGGEKVSGMPFQVIGDDGAFATAPSSCSSGGGTSLNTVEALGANGILGIGTTPTDCGSSCTVAGGYAAAIYYDCPSSGCGSIIARTSSTTAPFQQLPNPVAAMSVDNNGTIISLPNPPASGETSETGMLYFGIGTQTNTGLGSAAVLTAPSSTSPLGPGLITVGYKGQSLPDSFIDSGSGIYFFTDGSLAQCTGADLAGYYCPTSSTTLSLALQGLTGSTSVSLPLYNAQTLLTSSYAVLPGLGGDPTSLGIANPYPTSFDLGLPFFFGRKVYTAIEGLTAGGSVGPYYAF